MSAARQMILERIRSARTLRMANGGRDGVENYDAISRAYQRTSSLETPQRVELFQNRLHEYGVGVYSASIGQIASAVREIVTAHSKQHIVIPSGTPGAWLPEGCVFTVGNSLTPNELDQFDGVLTGCTVAIAMTGSIVLRNVAGQGPRKLSLIPDYHLCVVFAEQIVETVPEAFELLESNATMPTTFISGPSATSDIEMTRIQGVHGPRFLDVIIVSDNDISNMKRPNGSL